MANVSMNIKAMSPTGKNTSVAVTNINPEATRTQLSELAHQLNALTSNTFISAIRISQSNVDTESSGQQTPTITFNPATATRAAIRATYGSDIGFEVAYTYTGDGELYLQTHQGYTGVILRPSKIKGSGKVAMYISDVGEPDAAPIFTLYATETDNYKAVSATFAATD